uniref:Uncharacterized protein n=1 Tax=Trichuris muris TaxID=70415 RepID=A0A5S6QWK3_TRIMR
MGNNFWKTGSGTTVLKRLAPNSTSLRRVADMRESSRNHDALFAKEAVAKTPFAKSEFRLFFRKLPLTIETGPNESHSGCAPFEHPCCSVSSFRAQRRPQVLALAKSEIATLSPFVPMQKRALKYLLIIYNLSLLLAFCQDRFWGCALPGATRGSRFRSSQGAFNAGGPSRSVPRAPIA